MSNLVKIENKNWKLNVDLNGGRIESLSFDNKLILGTFDRIDGKSGNTHVCVPNFAEDGMNIGLPFHGPFRGMEWKLDENNQNKIIIVAENMGLEVKQIFEIGEKCSQKLIVKNIGKDNQPLNMAIHDYWSVNGNWLGTRLNNENIEDGIIDSDFVESEGKNVIEFVDGRKIELELKGFDYLKLWTGFTEENEQKVFDVGYICVEPVQGKSGEYFGTEKSILKPGEVREVEQIISL